MRRGPSNDIGERLVGIWNRLIKLILRLGGTLMGLAVFAVFMPTAWMEQSSVLLGLEPLADTALSQYLTRSLSLLYAVHGALLWVASLDPERMAPMITAIAVLNLVLAGFLGGIDLKAGMPAFWTVSEVVVPAASGLLILFLQSRARRELATAPEGS